MASEAVLKIFDDLKALHIAKDADYAGDEPLSNFRRCEQFGIPAWRGCLVRLSDKFSRVVSLVQKDGGHAVNGESLIDTLHDMAVYSIITSVLLGEEQGATRGCVRMKNEGGRVKGVDKPQPCRYEKGEGWKLGIFSDQEDVAKVYEDYDDRFKECGP